MFNLTLLSGARRPGAATGLCLMLAWVALNPLRALADPLPPSSMGMVASPDPIAVELKVDLSDPRADALIQSQLHKVMVPGMWAAEPLFHRSAAALVRSRNEAAQVLGDTAPHLDAWRRISLAQVAPSVRARAAADIVNLLSSLKCVQLVEKVPEMAPAVIWTPPSDEDACPIRTPLYDGLQTYLAPAPAGIDVGVAWEYPGGRGQGLWFADIEGGWNAAHEDLPGDRIRHVAGHKSTDRGWESHGTAVLGVVASRDNRMGMIGITPNLDQILTGSVVELDTAGAIDETASKLRPGDVLLIELHGPGPRSYPGGGQKGYVPVEWWASGFDVIKFHVARGIVIVEAAGNGAEDLDDPIYKGHFDRNRDYSGAIMIGAGAPSGTGWVDRSRLDFSNYGSRVDLQGYGRMVATLDYGDLQGCGSTSRKYTHQFAGTSSASPVVAGAILSLQGIYRARTGTVLSGESIRDMLVKTGSPQTDGPHGPASQHIGPRPDLAKAILALPGVKR